MFPQSFAEEPGTGGTSEMEAQMLRCVRDAKLQVHFFDQYTQHTSPPVSHGQNGSKTSQRVERWKKEKLIGTGASGTVWLERCVSPIAEVGREQLRAVKQIAKQLTQDGNSPPEYWREIEAIMKFSEPQVLLPQCYTGGVELTVISSTKGILSSHMDGTMI